LIIKGLDEKTKQKWIDILKMLPGLASQFFYQGTCIRETFSGTDLWTSFLHQRTPKRTWDSSNTKKKYLIINIYPIPWHHQLLFEFQPDIHGMGLSLRYQQVSSLLWMPSC